jgi:hypothetical protein
MWQGSCQLPDPKIGWCILNGSGGHPGESPKFMIVRRWIAPQDGWISISGTLQHPNKEGDGVRGRIVSSRTGEIGVWKVLNKSQETKASRIEVKKDDTIDFVVDCLANVNSDSFLWSPVIRLTNGSSETIFDANADFRGPNSSSAKKVELTNWDRLAQVLLLSNEFAFVD